MSDSNLAEVWRQGRERLNREHAPKDADIEIPMRMSKTYSRLTDSEREQIIPLLREWLLSDELSDRSVALFIVEDNAVSELVPELRLLQDRLERSDDRYAVHEWKLVNRALGRVLAGERRTWD